MCPLGTLQDYQGTILKKKLYVPKWIMNIRYVFLALTVFIIVKVLFDLRTGEFFFKWTYQFYIWSFSIAVIIFLINFFIPRFWCKCICPVGSFSDIFLILENKVKFKK
tara:strand:- start:331 stop:654 length:324 start_codon:yes stop_codon:yes gene_type:complete